MKIKTRINLAFLSQYAVAGILIGSILLHFSFILITGTRIDLLQSLAVSKSAHIATYLEDNIEELKLILSRTQLLIDINNFNSSNQPEIRSEIVKKLTDSKKSLEEIKDIYLVGLGGRIEAATDQQEIGKDVSKEIFFTKGRFDFGVYIDKINNEWRLVFYGPFILNGETIGVGVSIVDLDDVEKIVKDYTGLGSTGEILIAFLDSDGNRVYPIQRRFERESIPIEKQTPLTAEPMKKALLGQKEVLKDVLDYRNKKVIAVSDHIELAKIGLVAKIDQKEIYADGVSLIFLFFGVLMLLMVAFYFVGHYLSAKITKPIDILRQGIKIIEGGDLEYRVGIDTKDEVGKLSQSFDKMVAAIKKSRAEIEKKVQQQTEQIIRKQEFLENQQKAVLNILEDVEEEKVTAERLAAIIRDAEEPINSQTLDGIITHWNRGAEDVYGYRAEEVIGKPIKTVVPRDRHQETEKILKDIGSGKTIEHFQTVRQKKDGSLVDVSVSFSPIKDVDGKIVGVSSIAMDITKERQIDKAKTEFVSLASHQLRTPLSAINWYTEMLLDGDAGKVNKEQKKYLEEIYKGNQRMVDLVNALLNVSRIELGTFAVDPAPTDFREVAKSVIAELRPQIENKKQKVLEKYDSKLSKVDADQKLVRIIFQNLLSNAVKYTPDQGRISITIGQDKKNINIEVADNGYGIPKSAQSKIFDKLFRADNIREKDTEGTGLGLYIVKSIIDQNGGKIWFDSRENKGTTFYVSLPLAGMKKKEGTKELTA